LAKKLVELSENRGAIFHYNSHVSRILTKDEKVIGVTLENGENISADAVVFNGDPRALATGAMGPDCQKIAPQTLKDKRSFSARVWSFAAELTGPDLIHHNVFFGQSSKSEFDDLAEGQMPVDPTIYICAQDRGQNAPYPKTERFEIILNAAPVYGAQTLEKEFETCRTRTFDTLGRFGLTFSPLPKEEALTTPADFASMFPASDGSLYGQSPHGLTAAFRRPTTRTQIQGLYLAGGGAHPGAGVPMATLSARHAAEAIIKDLTSTSSSPQMDMHGGISTESIELRSARFQSSDS
jgi:1-hydroxycarotenoid 3,4-desaturase